MRFLLILGFAALTSAGGYLYGKTMLRLSNRDLSAAWKMTAECVWLSLVFFALNLLVAFAGILISRVALGHFVSLYAANDVTLLPISVLQGIAFQHWRGAARRSLDLPPGC